MLASQGPKDNANPTVRTVEKDRSRAKREPLQWRQLGEFQRSPFQISSSSSPQAPAYFASQDPQRQEMCWFPTTSEDRSVLNALVDTQVATQGKGVALLSSLGLAIPSSTSDVLKHPHFRAAELTSTEEETKSHSSDPIPKPVTEWETVSSDEVFDIIRSIQDPEHPHTLEQLGVVCLEHVEVHDEGPIIENNPCTIGSVSTVEVRFT